MTTTGGAAVGGTGALALDTTGLARSYGDVVAVDGVDLYRVQDLLRPLGITIESIGGEQISLVLLILVAVGNAVGEAEAPWMTATVLTPSISLFGYVMLMFSSAMALSRDRDSSLLDRMLTAPVSAPDFIAGYSLPYLPVALAQTAVLFAIGTFFGLVIVGSVALVLVLLGLMAVFYIALGMVFGTTLTVNQVSGAYSAVLLLTIFGGAWVDLSALGGAFEAVANVFPVTHALDATRAVMADGAGLGEIASDLAWVTGWTLASAAGAVGLFRRQMIR